VLVMEKISTSANGLVFIEFKAAVGGSSDRSLCPMDDPLGEFWWFL